MSGLSEIAIIGAGPYGLSISAHLSARNIPHRIFGRTMEAWATQMPKGMHLKSDGFATSLYDRGRTFTFERYCRERSIPYAALGVPPRLEDFVGYGREFQRRLVPHLEETLVERLSLNGSHYRLQLETGALCEARAVIVAAGISQFAVLPEAVAGLPKTLVTHAADHHDLDAFKARKVAVIGAGASAADLAGLLHEAGADVHLIARGSQIAFHTKMRLPRPLRDRLRNPSSEIGPGWRSFLFTKFPYLFRHLPEARRLRIVRNYLGPAPGYFMRDRVIGKVTLHLDLQLVEAKQGAGGVILTCLGKDGAKVEIQAGHVICGTGYKTQLSRLPFLDQSLLARIDTVEGSPTLSANFESSVPGLYFAGATAANTFGPMLRFACGAGFAAPRLARHLSRRHKRFARPARTIPDAQDKAQFAEAPITRP
jgi:hypothetical protein